MLGTAATSATSTPSTPKRPRLPPQEQATQPRLNQRTALAASIRLRRRRTARLNELHTLRRRALESPTTTSALRHLPRPATLFLLLDHPSTVRHRSTRTLCLCNLEALPSRSSSPLLPVLERRLAQRRLVLASYRSDSRLNSSNSNASRPARSGASERACRPVLGTGPSLATSGGSSLATRRRTTLRRRRRRVLREARNRRRRKTRARTAHRGKRGRRSRVRRMTEAGSLVKVEMSLRRGDRFRQTRTTGVLRGSRRSSTRRRAEGPHSRLSFIARPTNDQALALHDPHRLSTSSSLAQGGRRRRFLRSSRLVNGVLHRTPPQRTPRSRRPMPTDRRSRQVLPLAPRRPLRRPPSLLRLRQKRWTAWSRSLPRRLPRRTRPRPFPPRPPRPPLLPRRLRRRPRSCMSGSSRLARARTEKFTKPATSRPAGLSRSSGSGWRLRRTASPSRLSGRSSSSRRSGIRTSSSLSRCLFPRVRPVVSADSLTA